MSVADSSFEGHDALAGAVLETRNSVLTMSGGMIARNHVESIGPADARAEAGTGGALRLIEVTANITGLQFIENAATDAGGAIYMDGAIRAVRLSCF